MENWKQIKLMEQTNLITIAVDRAAANTFMSSISSVHGWLNTLNLAIMIWIPVSYFMFNWIVVILSIVGLFIWTRTIQNIACARTRIMMIEDFGIFNMFWNQNKCLLRNNKTGHQVKYPNAWQEIFDSSEGK